MPIENSLERIAVALETLAAIAKGNTPAAAVDSANGTDIFATGAAAGTLGNDTTPGAKQEEARPARRRAAAAPATPAAAATAAPGETVPTKEDIAERLRALVGIKGPDVAREVLTKHGVARLSELPVEKYAAIYKDMKEKIGG